MNIKKLAAGALAATAVAVAAPGIAHADPVRNFFVFDKGLECQNYTDGSITWHNRTATISGRVVDMGAGFTTAKFRAFANGRQVGSDVSRYADDASTNPTFKSPRKIGFGIGDTNLSGGIDQIVILLCFTETSCQYSKSYTRP